MSCKTVAAFVSLFGIACHCAGIYSENIAGYERTEDHGTTNTTTVFYPADSFPETASNVPPRNLTAPIEPRPNLYLAELLSYATVQITCDTSNGLRSAATGFFFSFRDKKNPSLNIPVIISNRHAVQDATSTLLRFTVAKNGFPSDEVINLAISNGVTYWVGHPNSEVDLCALPIAPILDYLNAIGKPAFISPLDSTLIPDADTLKTITQLDEVIMIGYPGAIIDQKNNQPVFRRGTLATNPSLDFNGKQEFLIDMPVFCGSSGSPVMLYSEGAYFERSRRKGGSGMHLGSRLQLLGVTYATMQADIRGQLVPIPIPAAVVDEDSAISTNMPTNTTGGFYFINQFKIPNNIGLVIKASRLLEFEKYLYDLIQSGP